MWEIYNSDCIKFIHPINNYFIQNFQFNNYDISWCGHEQFIKFVANRHNTHSSLHDITVYIFLFKKNTILVILMSCLPWFFISKTCRSIIYVTLSLIIDLFLDATKWPAQDTVMSVLFCLSVCQEMPRIVPGPELHCIHCTLYHCTQQFIYSTLYTTVLRCFHKYLLVACDLKNSVNSSDFNWFVSDHLFPPSLVDDGWK